MATNFKQSSISAALALAVSASLLKMEPSNYPNEEIAVFTQAKSELFEYVTRSDEFHEVCALIFNNFVGIVY